MDCCQASSADFHSRTQGREEHDARIEQRALRRVRFYCARAIDAAPLALPARC